MNPNLSRALVDAHHAELERRHTDIRPPTLGWSPSRTGSQSGSSRTRRMLTSLALSGSLMVGGAAIVTIGAFGVPVAASADPPVIGTPTESNVAKPWDGCRPHSTRPVWVCESDTGGWLFRQKCSVHGGTMVNNDRCEVPMKD